MRIRVLRFTSRAVLLLVGLTLLLLPVGCWSEEQIEVAVLYWGQVQTSAGAPVPGRTVHFAAARFWGDTQDDAVSVQRRSAATSSDGRTYLDVRFMLSSGQSIVLAASTTTTDPLANRNQSVVREITFAQAHDQEEKQGGVGLASFELTAEFTE